MTARALTPGSARAGGVVGAAASTAVAAIFIVQEICLSLAVDPSSADELVRVGVQPVNLLRARLMFVLFFLQFIAYAALYLRRRSFASLLGLIFGAVAGLFEIGYRAVELEALFKHWLPALWHAQSTAEILLARTRIENFYVLVAVAYRVIGTAGPLSYLCFGVETVRGADTLERVVGALFLANCVRLLLPWMGLAWINEFLFIALMAPLYLAIGAWLWRSSARRDAEGE